MKIAIVKLSALGDIVHAMIVLQFIKKHNQKIEIDWIVEESYQGLLNFHPDIKKVHVVNLKNVKKKKSALLFLGELKKIRQLGPYDLVIDLQGLIKSALIAWAIPSSITLGFDKSSTRESMASFFYNKTYRCPYDKNVIERNLSLVKFSLGVAWSKEEIHHKLPFINYDQKYLTTDLSSIKKNIILVPGASFKAKIYPAIKFAQIVNKLDANFLVVWGSEAEKKIADEIKVLAPNITVKEKLTLDSLISLISQVNLVIGSDTGPTHIAWALNIPSITLYGPTPGYRNSYKTEINQVIESTSQVNPYKINKNDFSIKEIKVVDIVKISHELLKVS